MPRKVGISVRLTQAQLEWMDGQNQSNAELIRSALSEYMGENNE